MDMLVRGGEVSRTLPLGIRFRRERVGDSADMMKGDGGVLPIYVPIFVLEVVHNTFRSIRTGASKQINRQRGWRHIKQITEQRSELGARDRTPDRRAKRTRRARRILHSRRSWAQA